MTAFVPDCSVAAAWLFADEAGPETDKLLAGLKDGGALVPNLWHLEVGNMLLQAEKRGRISAPQITRPPRPAGRFAVDNRHRNGAPCLSGNSDAGPLPQADNL